MRLERPFDAEPGEVVAIIMDARSEFVGMTVANRGIGPIGSHQNVAVREVWRTRRAVLEAQIDTDASAYTVQLAQQRQPLDCGIGAAVDQHTLPAMHDVLVGPVLHLALETLDHVGAALGEKLQCAAGQHDPETERHVRGILLEHPNSMGGIATLEQIGKVEAGGTGANDMKQHCSVPCLLVEECRSDEMLAQPITDLPAGNVAPELLASRQ